MSRIFRSSSTTSTVAVPLFLLLFAATYMVMATISASSFSQPVTRTSALYFTVTVFGTVGFGDIAAKTEAARLLVTGQMIIDHPRARGKGDLGRGDTGPPAAQHRCRAGQPVSLAATREDHSPMTSGVVAEAAGLFAVTNCDDIVVLALFFGQGAGEHGAARRVVIGQYLAFTAILAVALSISFGASFLPKDAIPYLGLIPLTIGVWDAWKLWRNRRRGGTSEQDETAAHTRQHGRWPGRRERAAAP